MVEANPEQQDFIIRKAPMIRKNEQPLDSVYRRDPKVIEFIKFLHSLIIL